MLERSTRRGCCRFATIANRSERQTTLSAALAHRDMGRCGAHLFVPRGSDCQPRFQNRRDQPQSSPVVSSTDWYFVEAIDTLAASPPSDVADFQRLLYWLRVDGFYLFEAGVTPRNYPPDGAPEVSVRSLPILRMRTVRKGDFAAPDTTPRWLLLGLEEATPTLLMQSRPSHTRPGRPPPRKGH